jgi:DNA (cytosine-5)-methyltransferase 1
MTAYYNEWDKNAAAWLRELIKQKLIADGEVDERSITEVSAGDLRGFDQCHFFAGIGGWSLALRLAGVPDDYPVWTASLPCQPFSAAGKQLGKDDERHLLPHFLELVRQCRPSVLFGEQVPGAIRHRWLDDLYAEMEACDYSIGSVIVGAHSVGSFHQRQRLYWVADYTHTEHKGNEVKSRCESRAQGKPGRSCLLNSMGDPSCEHAHKIGKVHEGKGNEFDGICPWGNPEWLPCRDNKYRPIKPGLKPLVDGISKGVVPSRDPDYSPLARGVRLKGYGNAIVPQVAAEFIGAYFDLIGGSHAVCD